MEVKRIKLAGFKPATLGHTLEKNYKEIIMNNLLFVTGAGSGIGKETSTEISSLFNQVILVGRDSFKLKLTKEIILKKEESHQDSSVITYSCDLAKEANIIEMIKNLNKTLLQASSITLINNAAIFEGHQNFENSTAEDWTNYFNINLMGTLNLTRGLLPYMKPKSFKNEAALLLGDYHSIINIASTAGTRVVGGLSAYGSLKAALIYWSNAIALELGPKYIRVNVVAPGLIDTPIHSFYSENKNSKEYAQANNAQVLNRMGQPKDVAEAIKYLCTSSWVTGATLTVDGGLSI